MSADGLEWNGSQEDRQLYTAYESLMNLVESYLHDNPDDHYLRTHFQVDVLLNQARSVRWYLRWFPTRGRVLDWGCRFAPDSYLLRRARPDLELHGCDMEATSKYQRFHQASGVDMKLLSHPVALPYPDGYFDAVVGAGVLEHVRWDYESLKELHRVLKPRAPLVITYLPYLRSRSEQLARMRQEGFHLRLYTTKETSRLLLSSGFYPLVIEYQQRITRNEMHDRILNGLRNPILRARQQLKTWLGNKLRDRSAEGALCAVAEKRDEM
jgi:SAM-dependent methyltransferase